MNLCVECKHCAQFDGYAMACTKEWKSPVVADTQRAFLHCIDLRSTEWACGAKGRGFERKADKPVVDWAAMPRWINFVARDEEEGWHGFSHKPHLVGAYNEWYVNDELGDDKENIMLDIPWPWAPQWAGDWRESLVERPEGV